MLLSACQGAPQENKSSVPYQKSSSPNPNFCNSRHNFSPIKWGSNKPSQRQDLCLPFLYPRHISQCLGHQRHSEVIRQNQPNLPSHFIMWRQRQKPHPPPCSQFSMQMAGACLLIHSGLHGSIHSLTSPPSSPSPTVRRHQRWQILLKAVGCHISILVLEFPNPFH